MHLHLYPAWVGCRSSRFRPRIDQKKIALAQRVHVSNVMQHSGVRAGANNRSVRRAGRAVTTKDRLDQRLDFVLFHARAHGLHGLDVGFGGDICGALHDLYLFVTLEHAHLMNDRSRVDNRSRRFQRLAIRLPHQRQLANDFLVHLWSAVPEGVVEDCRPIQQFGEFFVKLADRKRLVGAVVAHCAINPGAIAIPNFAFRITWSHE